MTSVKSKLLRVVEDINDEVILKLVIDDLIFYTTQTDVVEILKQDQFNVFDEDTFDDVIKPSETKNSDTN
jgi:hypothetical protein